MAKPAQTAEEIDFELRCLMREIVILLGGKKEVADLLVRSVDYGVTNSDLEAVRSYGYELLVDAKRRLSDLTAIKVKTRKRVD